MELANVPIKARLARGDRTCHAELVRFVPVDTETRHVPVKTRLAGRNGIYSLHVAMAYTRPNSSDLCQ